MGVSRRRDEGGGFGAEGQEVWKRDNIPRRKEEREEVGFQGRGEDKDKVRNDKTTSGVINDHFRCD